MTGNFNLRQAAPEDAVCLAEIAQKTWWRTYPGIIKDAQIAYMLARGYTAEAVKLSMQQHTWWILENALNKKGFGFMATSVRTDGMETWLFVNKLYLLPAMQGTGLGRFMIGEATAWARTRGIQTLKLNVNRKNPSYHFYLKTGFEVECEADFPYAGYVLNDYVMRRKV